MKPTTFIRIVVSTALLFATTYAQSLLDQFQSPPDTTRPGCYWYWVNDNVSKEGITKDLEAMARVGIGRAYIGHIFNTREGAKATPVGEAKMFSNAWWQALQWAIKEADRCGVDIGFFNSPGWSQSGGPWIKTPKSMRYLASSETVIDGGTKVDLVLPTPKIKTFPSAGGGRPQGTGELFSADDFQQVRVIAFKQPASEANELDMKLADASSPTLKGLTKLLDGSNTAAVNIEGSHVIDFTFEKAQSLQSLILDPIDSSFTINCTLEAIDADGNAETLIQHTEQRGHQGPLKADPLQIPFTPVKSNHLRVTIESAKPANFCELKLSRRATVSYHVRKQLGETSPSTNPRWDAYHWPTQPSIAPDTAIDPKRVIDLTDHVDATGRLQWDAPAGRWVVLRTGMLPTGIQCAPASPEGRGLEVDKMSKQHIRDHFDAMVGEFIKRTPAEDRKAFKYVIADSYETGPQNWTDEMIGMFEKRFAYSPVPYLPCLSGRIVGSPELSTRFLWDWRRLIAESIAYDYVGGLREIANENGLKLWLENYGHWGFPSEFLLYGAQADEVGGEFWESASIFGNIECRAASSCANSYGRNDIYAEAFTSNRNFKQSPAELKSIIDWVFSAGVNQLILHVNIHQPDERKPGIIQWFGTAFNRHNTWFEQSKAFIDYVRRCGVMLKHGSPQVDVAYYIGQDAPVMTGPLDPPLPDGYDYNHINADALVHRATVVDGRIHMENGPSYAVLVLPDQPWMTPEVAATIRKLVSDGATIVGPQPTASPSLQDYPDCDATVASITDPMWRKSAGQQMGHIAFGKGMVFPNASLVEVLDTLKLAPDLSVKGSGILTCAVAGNGKIGRKERGGIVFKHRSSADQEIYFLANTTNKSVDFTASFRINGRKPTFWNPVTGEANDVLAFSQENGRTQIPIQLDASGSLFVVFAEQIDSSESGRALTNFPAFVPLLPLTGPWNVRFDGLGAPQPSTFESLIDWTKHPDPAIQNFSGSATYTTTFTLDQQPADQPLRIHLGKVGVIAEVTLNGQPLGTVWTKPWTIKPGRHLMAGENTLDIRVTNTWNNRLVADSKLPANERLTHISQDYRIDQKSPLRSSGLIGPVAIQKGE